MLKNICCSCVLLVLPSILAAEQVEMIVFLHLDAKLERHELWPLHPGELKLDKIRNIAKIDKLEEINRLETLDKLNNFNLAKVNPEELILVEEFKRLKLSRPFRPIYHIAWKERIIKEGKAIPVYFSNIDENNIYELEGLVSLKNIKYNYHAKLDMIFKHKDLIDVDAIRLEQIAKFKNKELYYFDHPIFGVLLKVVA